MRNQWKTNLVSAFPIPDDRRPGKLGLKGSAEDKDEYVRNGIFDFLSLPSELRNRIYTHLLTSPKTCHTDNRLALALTSHRLHSEITYLLYTTTPFRLFPLQDFTSTPTLLTIPPHYRTHIRTLAWNIGSSWTSPPKAWRCGKALARCLGRMKHVKTLKIFVEMDPSEPMFAKYRISKVFYTNFTGNLLGEVLACLPMCKVIEMDGNPSVRVSGELVSRLRQEIERKGKEVVWGPEAGWEEKLLKSEEEEWSDVEKLLSEKMEAVVL